MNEMQDVLLAEIAQLRAALEPFADCAGWIPRGWPDDKPIEELPSELTAGDFRRAFAALRTREVKP